MELGTFETSDVDFAAYLIINGVSYLNSYKILDSKTNKEKVVFKFKDDKGIARDLIRIFITSSEKQYREALKFLLREIHKIM